MDRTNSVRLPGDPTYKERRAWNEGKAQRAPRSAQDQSRDSLPWFDTAPVQRNVERRI